MRALDEPAVEGQLLLEVRIPLRVAAALSRPEPGCVDFGICDEGEVVDLEDVGPLRKLFPSLGHDGAAVHKWATALADLDRGAELCAEVVSCRQSQIAVEPDALFE
jgi:hypothetical protein